MKVEGVGAGEGGTAGGGDQSKNPFFQYNADQPGPLKFTVPVNIYEQGEGLIGMELQAAEGDFARNDMFICRRFPQPTDINRIFVPGIGICALDSVLRKG